MSSSRYSTPIRWLTTDTPFIPPVDEEDLPSHQPQQPLYWNILLLICLSSERQIKIRKIQCFILRHELEDILDDGLASRQNMTPSAIGEFLIRISNGKFGAGQCPILLPQDVDVTDFGDLSEADDSVLLHLMAEPKENYVWARKKHHHLHYDPHNLIMEVIMKMLVLVRAQIYTQKFSILCFSQIGHLLQNMLRNHTKTEKYARNMLEI